MNAVLPRTEPPGHSESGRQSSRGKLGLPQGVFFNVVLPVCLLALGGAVVLALGTAESDQRVEPDNSRAGRLKAMPAVRVERVRSLAATGSVLNLKAEGNVVPYREARVAAEVAGRISSKAEACEAGNFVTEGQLLMRIDPTDYELEVQRLTRLKEQEYQALQEVDQEMINTNRLIEVAQRDVQLQQEELDRLRSLTKGFASRAELDQSERALLQARQQLVTLQNQLDLLRKRRVRLEAAEQLAATQLRAAEVNLERTEIKSPLNGVIVSEDVDLNSFVSRGTTLVTIEDISKVEVASSLRMDQLHWILDQRENPELGGGRGYDLPDTEAIIEYSVSGREGSVYRWQGRLLSYDGIGMDPATRTVPVRVVVDNPRQFVDQSGTVKQADGPTPLVRGMYVQIRLLVEPRTPLVVLPARALRPGNRVWQFVPDESVLHAAAAEPVVLTNSDATPTAQSPATSAGFEPSEWVAGRVLVQRGVAPVDSLAAAPQQAAGDSTPSATSLPERMWVCEVRDQTVSDGSFVVVSPLGSVDQQGISARAPAEVIYQVPAEATGESNAGASADAEISPIPEEG